MAKEAYYFSHDYNSRNDQKMVRLQMKHGMMGVGIFWCLVEMLYEEGGKIMRTECERIAFELRTNNECIQSVLSEFGLFYFDGDYFRSESVDRRLSQRNQKSQKARNSVEKRWKNTNVLRTYDDSNTIKERKGKEIKRKEIKEDNNAFNKIESEMLNSEQWLEAEAMKFKTTVDDIKAIIPTFIIHVKGSGRESITLHECKNWFNNWGRSNIKPVKRVVDIPHYDGSL